MKILSNKSRYKYMRLLSRIPIVRQIGVFLSIKLAAKNTVVNPTMERVELKPNYDFNRVVSELREDGISNCFRLKKETVKKLFEYIDTKPVFAYRNVKWGYYLKDKKQMEKKIGKNILLSQYFNIEENELFSDILHSPLLLKVAKSYLGPAIKTVGTILWWTHPANVSKEERIKQAHFFHRDVDDYKFLKIFFYLTDMNDFDGAHVFVKGSHKPGFKEFFEEGLKVKRYDDNQINSRYPNKTEIVLGKSGDGFAEDTLGFHKANSPIKRPRLAFEVVYAINDYNLINDHRNVSGFVINEF